jgi:hypothetical protein
VSPSRRRWGGAGLRSAALWLLLAALPSCGKRGEPQPPLARTPQGVTGLALAQRGDRLEVRFVAPRTTTSGLGLPVLEVELLRAEKEGPIEKVAQSDRRRAAPGESLVETLPLPAPGTQVRLAARARVGREASALSTVVGLTVQPPPPAPSGLAARLEAQGIALSWKPPVLPSPSPTPSPTPTPSPAPSPTPTPTPSLLSATAPGVKATPAPSPSPAIVIYRGPPRGEPQPLVMLAPTAAAHADTSVAPGQHWCYTVRTTLGREPLVESAPSEERCLEVKDVFPPAAPVGVAVLPVEDGLEVSWSPSPEMDLSAYRLYRSAEGPVQRVGEAPAGTTVLKDKAAPVGVKLVYTVTAVDKAGNESKPSGNAEARR